MSASAGFLMVYYAGVSSVFLAHGSVSLVEIALAVWLWLSFGFSSYCVEAQMRELFVWQYRLIQLRQQNHMSTGAQFQPVRRAALGAKQQYGDIKLVPLFLSFDNPEQESYFEECMLSGMRRALRVAGVIIAIAYTILAIQDMTFQRNGGGVAYG